MLFSPAVPAGGGLTRGRGTRMRGVVSLGGGVSSTRKSGAPTSGSETVCGGAGGATGFTNTAVPHAIEGFLCIAQPLKETVAQINNTILVRANRSE